MHHDLSIVKATVTIHVDPRHDEVEQRFQARCSCQWSGELRYSQVFADIDADRHRDTVAEDPL